MHILRSVNQSSDAALLMVNGVGRQKQPRQGFGPIAASSFLLGFWDAAIREQLLDKAMPIHQNRRALSLSYRLASA